MNDEEIIILEKRHCYEVNNLGEIVEYYLLDDDEISSKREEGKNIIDFLWGEGLYSPLFDFESNSWVEGLSQEEVAAREEEIQKQGSMALSNEELKDESEMNALAIMELAELILGG